MTRLSPCKINLILNVLGKRPDGYHDLETLFFPVPFHDELRIELTDGDGISLTCSNPLLPVDGSNLTVKAAELFRQQSGIVQGIQMNLEKRIPLAAGLGGGSGNAAQVLLGLNELHGFPLKDSELHDVAARLGSDVNYFLQPNPALAFGRGEKIQPLPAFECLRGHVILLCRPGFGIPTPWAFQTLAQFPESLLGQAGRAASLAQQLVEGDWINAGKLFFNSLESPVFSKYPILANYQKHLRDSGAWASLMSGSGSTTFAIFSSAELAKRASERFAAEFGQHSWQQLVPIL